MRKKPRISPARARAKGLQFEREVSHYFRMIGFIRAGRNLEFQTKHAVGVDIEDVGPFRVQCKNLFKYANPSMINEIKDKTGIPLLVTKGHALPPMVVLPMTDFLRMAESYMRESKEQTDWSDPQQMDLGF